LGTDPPVSLRRLGRSASGGDRGDGHRLPSQVRAGPATLCPVCDSSQRYGTQDGERFKIVIDLAPVFQDLGPVLVAQLQRAGFDASFACPRISTRALPRGRHGPISMAMVARRGTRTSPCHCITRDTSDPPAPLPSIDGAGAKIALRLMTPRCARSFGKRWGSGYPNCHRSPSYSGSTGSPTTRPIGVDGHPQMIPTFIQPTGTVHGDWFY
jgi:hypothetical protein